MKRERIRVIVNPAAGRGRGARMTPEIHAAFAGVGASDVRTTAAAGDELRLASEAIAEGCTTLVAVGGDGVAANVANAILRSHADTRLAVIGAGTGNDFARLLGTDGIGAHAVAALCALASETRVDVGRVEDVFFLNSCGFGFDVAVVEGIARTRWLRGSSVYLYTALRELFAYSGITVAVGSEGSRRQPARHLLLAIANGARFGGGFEIAPGASVSDGKLDAVSILDAAPARRLALLAAARKGRHTAYPECVIERSAEFEVAFDKPPHYEADGELHRARSATLRISSCPSALRVVAGPRVQLA